MPLSFVQGDATRPVGEGQKVLVHCVNNVGKWGKGFVLAVSKRWLRPQIAYRAWFEKPADWRNHPEGVECSGPLGLGQVQLVRVHPEITVANLVGQDGIRYPGSSAPSPIRYEAIARGFRLIRMMKGSEDFSLHMPRLGTGLAGGDWNRIEAIVRMVFPDTNITVYDLP